MALDNKKIGMRIRNFRDKKGMSQEELADKVHSSRKHISLVETGASGISLDLLVDLAKVLEVSADDILQEYLPNVKSSADEEMHRLMLDCTRDEEQFLIKNAAAVKQLLREFGI